MHLAKPRPARPALPMSSRLPRGRTPLPTPIDLEVPDRSPPATRRCQWRPDQHFDRSTPMHPESQRQSQSVSAWLPSHHGGSMSSQEFGRWMRSLRQLKSMTRPKRTELTAHRQSPGHPRRPPEPTAFPRPTRAGNVSACSPPFLRTYPKQRRSQSTQFHNSATRGENPSDKTDTLTEPAICR